MPNNALIGALRVDLGLDTAQFTEGLTSAQKELKKVGKSMQDLGGKLSNIGAGLSIGITAPVVALGVASMQAAKESKLAFAQVEAALKSMGSAAGRSAEQLKAQAAQLQATSTFDDDDILGKVTANLLTFGNVSGQAFDRAQQAAVDLSARLGQDLQSSAIQLGKALNDPVKGVSALAKVGVSFTEQQKAQIKAMAEAGDVAGAQGLILNELEKQYGGAAQAMRDATPEAATVDAWREFQETIGEVALKVLPPLTAMLTRVLDGFNTLDPGLQTMIIGGAALAATLGPIVVGIGSVVSAVGVLWPLLATLGTFLVEALIPTAIITAPVWGPIALAIAAVGAAIFALIKFWPQIKAWATGVAMAMGEAASQAVKSAKALFDGVKLWLGEKLLGVFNWVRDKAKAVGDAFFQLYDRVVGHSYIPDMVEGVATWMAKLDKGMVAPAQSATEATGRAFEVLGDDVVSVFADIPAATLAANDNLQTLADTVDLVGIHFDTAGELMAQAFDDTARAVDGVYRSLRSKDWTGLIKGVQDVVTSIKSAYAAAGGGFNGAGSAAGAAAGALSPYVGGVGGSALSGVAMGAQLGAMIGPIGAGLGAVIGGVGGLIGGLFGSSKKKKAAKKAAEEAARQAAEQAAAEEAARLQAIANTRRELDIQLLEELGRGEEALAMRREDALAAIDPSLRALQQQVWAQQDLTKAQEEAAAAAEAAAQVAEQAAEAASQALAATISRSADAVAEGQAALQAAYDREAEALQGRIGRYKDLAGALRAYGKSISDGAGIAARYQTVSRLAGQGDEQALSELVDVSEQYRDQQRATATSLADYLRKEAEIRRNAVRAADAADQQVSVAERQLSALDQSVAGLIALNDGVLSVRDAISYLGVALGEYARVSGRSLGANPSANAALASATGYAGDFGTGGFQAWIVEQDEATKAAARQILTAFGQTGRINGFKTGGGFEVGGFGGADSQLVQAWMSPGEMVNVSKADTMAQLADELGRTNARLEQLIINSGQSMRLLKKFDDDGVWVHGEIVGENIDPDPVLTRAA